MRKVVLHELVVTFSILFCLSCVVSAAPERAKDIYEKNRDAVILVTLVTRNVLSESGREYYRDQQKVERTATLISPEGVAVLSLSAAHLASKFAGMMFGYESEVEITKVRMELPGGERVPAEVVLQDKELDLLFVQPKEKVKGPLPFVDLRQGAKGALLDEIAVISRLGKLGNNTAFIRLGAIEAVMEKPRTVYIPSVETIFGGPGGPVFSVKEGKPIGLLVLRSSPKPFTINDALESVSGILFRGPESLGILHVVVPASSILEVASQLKPK